VIYGFNNEADARDLLLLLQRFRAAGGALNIPSNTLLRPSGTGILWAQVPTGGIPKLSGAWPGKPGKAKCLIWHSDNDDDVRIQLKDSEGDNLEVDVYHYGFADIPELDHNGDPRMIKVAPEGDGLTAIVDYCAP